MKRLVLYQDIRKGWGFKIHLDFVNTEYIGTNDDYNDIFILE